MKIIARLPESKYYSPLRPRGELNVWLDKATRALEILSPEPNPFGMEMTMIVSVQEMKTDESQYPYKLTLRCYPCNKDKDNELERFLLVRERFKGIFAFSQKHKKYGYPLFFAFPIEEKDKLWLSYSFFPLVA